MSRYSSKKSLTTNEILSYPTDVELPAGAAIGTIALVEAINRFYIKYGTTEWRQLVESSGYAGPVLYSLARGPIDGIVNENGAMTVYINTVNIPNSTTVNYTWSGITADDIYSELTGTAIILENAATVVTELVADGTTEGVETATFTLAATDSVGNSTVIPSTGIPSIAFTIEDNSLTPVDILGAVGQAEFSTAGTFSWTAPIGVTSVCVVAVGAGGAGAMTRGDINGNTRTGYGGGGGALGWMNDIPVTPGQTYTVIVGAGGTGASSPTQSGSRADAGGSGGTSSFFTGGATNYGITARGGAGGSGSGSGGSGPPLFSNPDNLLTTGGGAATFGGGGGYDAGGGAGAGGYTSLTGGAGGGNSGTAGQGGGGGGGSGDDYSSGNNEGGFSQTGGYGGGVGLQGQGASGGGGLWTYTSGLGGAAGAGGNGSWSTGMTAAGRGAPSKMTAYFNGTTTGISGGTGGVRIIWGEGREFPNTLTADQTEVVPVQIGQQSFTTVGTTTWTAPAGVTSVSVVAVGGGGGGVGHSYYSNYGGTGGGGGALVYVNNITVIPGNSYRVDVGNGGSLVNYTSTGLGRAANPGGASIFYDSENTMILSAGGGSGGLVTTRGYNTSNGSCTIYKTGNGGAGGSASINYPSGATGAAYDGGTSITNNYVILSGTQGGTGGTVWFGTTGGGSGTYTSAGTPGKAFRAATNRERGAGVAIPNSTGAEVYAGGGGTGDTFGTGLNTGPLGNGMAGAVRIIWPGDQRQFPTTRTADE